MNVNMVKVLHLTQSYIVEMKLRNYEIHELVIQAFPVKIRKLEEAHCCSPLYAFARKAGCIPVTHEEILQKLYLAQCIFSLIGMQHNVL